MGGSPVRSSLLAGIPCLTDFARFDAWQDQDTSRNALPPAPGAQGAPALLFGRGMLAGVDRSVQRSEQPQSANALAAARREERFERPAERQTKQMASTWREKSLEEMVRRRGSTIERGEEKECECVHVHV